MLLENFKASETSMVDAPFAQTAIAASVRRVVKTRSSVRQQNRKRTLNPSSMFLQKSLPEDIKRNDFLDIIRDFQTKAARMFVETEVSQVAVLYI